MSGFLILILSLFAFSGCAGNDPGISEDAGQDKYLELSTTSIDVACNITSATFDISSNMEWSLMVEGEGVSADHDSGSGDQTITLTFPANEKAGRVTVAIVTVAAGEFEKTLFVTQEGRKEDSDEPEDPGNQEEVPVTVTLTSFSSVSGKMDDVVSYESVQGGGTAEPAVLDSQIRLYQNTSGSGGGMITVSTSDGSMLRSVIIGSAMSTSITYRLGEGAWSGSMALNAGDKLTVSDLNVSSITFRCMGTTKNSRLYVNYLSVIYGSGTLSEDGGGPVIPDGPGGGQDDVPGTETDPLPPALDQQWLELASAPEGSNYHVDTFYADGERNYTYLYDKEMYTTLWAAYPLSSRYVGNLSRPGSWNPNPKLDESEQINVWDGSYGVGDYSRGHLVPNGSRNGIRAMQLQTFYATNSVPQIQNGFNGAIWNKLEEAVRGETEGGETIYVVTGVAFNKKGGSESISYIKPSKDTKKCPVPNYFYKLVLKVRTSGGKVTSASTVGFWFENKKYSNNDYENYSVSVDQVEAWTGHDFFVNLPDDVESGAERNSSWDTFCGF